ncbi:MAG: tetratricopeptide repeat protein, partial [Candidatus Thorarchaeota archaeon]
AEKAFKSALEYRPEGPDIWCNLGILLASVGRGDEAEAALKKAVEIKPEHLVAWLNLVKLLHTVGREEEAENAYDAAVSHVPGFESFVESLQDFVDEKAKDGES